MMGRSELLGAVRAIQSQHMEVVGRYRAALGDLEEAERTRAELAAEVGGCLVGWLGGPFNFRHQQQQEGRAEGRVRRGLFDTLATVLCVHHVWYIAQSALQLRTVPW